MSQEISNSGNDRACNFCGAQVLSPFGDGKVIHDVDQCRINSVKVRYESRPADADQGALLRLVADIRAAVGDPTGKLMQDELVAHCKSLVRRAKRAEESESFWCQKYKEAVNACEPIRGVQYEIGLQLGQCIILKGVPLLVERYRTLKDEKYAELSEAEARSEWLKAQLKRVIEIAELLSDPKIERSFDLLADLVTAKGGLLQINSLQPQPLKASPAPADEWRGIGMTEKIENGDLYQEKNAEGGWMEVFHSIGKFPIELPNLRFRTRRPLPKEEGR